MLQQGWHLVKNSSFIFTHYLSNVHTWAIFFLRHLANMSSMVGPLLSINWLWLCHQFGARVRSHTVRRRLFIVLMTAAHISPNVFSPRNFLSNTHVLLLTIHSTSFILFIHQIHTNNYTFYLHDIFTLSLLQILMAGRLPSVLCVRYT